MKKKPEPPAKKKATKKPRKKVQAPAKAVERPTQGGLVLNERQRQFAEHYATGLPAGRAYEKAGFSATGATADKAASRLLKNVDVCRYVETLRRWAASRSEDEVALTIEKKLRYLAKVVLTPVSDVDPTSPLCQEYTANWMGGRQGRLMRGNLPTGNEKEEQPETEIVKIKMPCKLRALELHAKLSGELTDKVEVEEKPAPVQTPAEKQARAKAMLTRWGAGSAFAPKAIQGETVNE